MMRFEGDYLLDFWAGSHGHFLEYVINCWIFNCPRVDNLFSDVGACHGKKESIAYQQNRLVHCGHVSQFDRDIIGRPKKIIRIAVDDFMGNCCYQINVIHRNMDIPKKEKELRYLPTEVRLTPALLRMDYYSKFTDEHCGYDLPKIWKFSDTPCFTVNMTSLYDFFEFSYNLNSMANFLGSRFRPDEELFSVWEQFLERNQGWNSWVLCNKFLTAIIANRKQQTVLNIEQQALLNALLSTTVGLFDGVLFDHDAYPTCASDINHLIQHHLGAF